MASWTGKLALLCAGVVIPAAWNFEGPAPTRILQPLTNDVYVWQRAWNDAVKDSIDAHAASFGELIVLNAEVSWQNGRQAVARVPLDYKLFQKSKRRIGLALRVGNPRAPMREDQVAALCELAASLVSDAKSHQLALAELQVDFDCPESKLADYRRWIALVRARVTPVPLTITTLPSWLSRAEFKRLISEVDGYVLQVHSLERPKKANAPFTLCDPAAARASVERAARLGKPFRVALPTYGYSIAFDSKGQFRGLSAEGPSNSWPDGIAVRNVRAEPSELAQLVAGWKTNRPQQLQGIIWYRLPVEGDTLNWNWWTLASVMNGELPSVQLRTEVRRPNPGLVEIELTNIGTAEFDRRIELSASWNNARLVACDGLQNFTVTGNGPTNITLTAERTSLQPGERKIIGWLRLTHETEVQIALQKN